MMVTEHCLARGRERFGLTGVEVIKNLVRRSRKRFWVMDRPHSMAGDQEMTRKEIVVDDQRRAWFVVWNHTVQTVLTEEMATNALKRGKWTKCA